MKQSNHAITFLLAQYRSIYQRAFNRGLSSFALGAALVTAASTAVSANSVTSENLLSEHNLSIQPSSVSAENGQALSAAAAAAAASSAKDSPVGHNRPALVPAPVVQAASSADAVTNVSLSTPARSDKTSVGLESAFIRPAPNTGFVVHIPMVDGWAQGSDYVRSFSERFSSGKYFGLASDGSMRVQDEDLHNNRLSPALMNPAPQLNVSQIKLVTSSLFAPTVVPEDEINTDAAGDAFLRDESAVAGRNTVALAPDGALVVSTADGDELRLVKSKVQDSAAPDGVLLNGTQLQLKAGQSLELINGSELSLSQTGEPAVVVDYSGMLSLNIDALGDFELQLPATDDAAAITVDLSAAAELGSSGVLKIISGADGTLPCFAFVPESSAAVPEAAPAVDTGVGTGGAAASSGHSAKPVLGFDYPGKAAVNVDQLSQLAHKLPDQTNGFIHARQLTYNDQEGDAAAAVDPAGAVGAAGGGSLTLAGNELYLKGSDLVRGVPERPLHFAASDLVSADRSMVRLEQAVLDLNSMTCSAGTDGSSRVAVDLVMGTGAALMLADTRNNNWQAQNLDVTSDGSIYVGQGSRLKADKLTVNGSALQPSVFLAPESQLSAASIDLEMVPDVSADGTLWAMKDAALEVRGDGRRDIVDLSGGDHIKVQGGQIDLNDPADTIGLTFNADKNGSFTADPDYVKFVVSDGTRVMVDLSAMNTGALSVSQGNELFDVIVERDQSTGLLSITGADLALPVTSSGRIHIDDLARAAGNGGAAIGSDSSSAGHGSAGTAGNNSAQDTAGHEIIIDFESAETRTTVVTGIGAQDRISGGWRALETKPGVTQVGVTDNSVLELNGTIAAQLSGSAAEAADAASTTGAAGGTGSEGKVEALAATSEGDVVGIALGQGAVLNLNSSGHIGSLTGRGTININGVDIMVVEPSGKPGDIDAGRLKLHKGRLSADEIKVDELESNSSLINATSLEISAHGLFKSRDSMIRVERFDAGNAAQAVMAGGVLHAGTIVADKMSLYQGASAFAQNIELRGVNSVFAVGGGTDIAGSEAADSSAPAASGSGKRPEVVGYSDNMEADKADKLNARLSGNINLTSVFSSDHQTGSVIKPVHTSVVAGNIDLKGGLLLLDPSREGTSSVFAQSISTLPLSPLNDCDGLEPECQLRGRAVSGKQSDPGIMKLSGDIIVGKGGSLGIGNSLEDFRRAVGKFQSISSYGIKDSADSVSPDVGVTTGMNKDTRPDTDFGAFVYIDRAGIDLGEHRIAVGTEDSKELYRILKDSPYAVYIGNDAAIQVTSRALQAEENVFVNMSGKVIGSQGGSLIVPVNVTGSEISQIFGDATLAAGHSIAVTTENGLMTGTISSTAQLQGKTRLVLHLAQDSRRILSRLSDPTYAMTMTLLSPETHVIGSFDSNLDNALSEVETGTGVPQPGEVLEVPGAGDLPDGNMSGISGDIIADVGSSTVPGTGDTISGDGSAGGTVLAPDNGASGSNGTGADSGSSGTETTPGTGDSSVGNGTGDSGAGTGEAGSADGSKPSEGNISGSGTGSGDGIASGGSGNADILENSRPGNGVVVDVNSSGYRFLREALGSVNYQAIDQVARMANFGGALQSVQLVSSSGFDAMHNRMGFGKGANMELLSGMIASDNMQGGSLWLAPVYRSYRSEDYDAQGREYGSDIELYGAVLGLDYENAHGLRFGAMFNTGDGNAEGKNAGEGISSDFSFTGLGLYAGWNLNNSLKLVADLSYSRVSGDFSAWTGVADYGMMTASADSHAISMGIGAQVTFRPERTEWEVSPHIALRYSRLGLDDYDVSIDSEKIARNVAEDMTMLSVPLGVSFARNFSMEQWTVRPAFDFTATANFADTDMKSSTYFNGITGSNFNYTTQVVDEFNCGITVGLAVLSNDGHTSFGFNAGYTGSVHSSEYGINATFRYSF